MGEMPALARDCCAQDTLIHELAFTSAERDAGVPDDSSRRIAKRPRSARRLSATGRVGSRVRPLTLEQQALAARHIGLVGVHLRTRLGFRRRKRADRREMGELFQAGCLALVQAAGHYDPQRHGEFQAYVLPRIRRAIHAAVLTGRHLVRVPYGAACKGRQARGYISARAHNPLPNGPDPNLDESLDRHISPDDESIRHALRRRFEIAARRAVEALSHQNWRRPDTPMIFARVTAERVLVSDPRRRTPVRRLAGELGISTGRVNACEQRVLSAAREQLRDDAAARLLIRFAQQDPAGFDGPVYAARRRRLVHAEVRQFERQFACLDASGQARTLYGLVKRSSAGVGEVARNLFLLARTDS